MLKTTISYKHHGPQLLSSKTQQSFHIAMVTMVHQVSTAKSQTALVPTDLLMDQLVLHALEPNQLQFHITTPTQQLEDHMLHQVTLLTVTHPHQFQHKSSSNLMLSQLPLLPQVFHHQRRFQSLTQRSPRLTLHSTANNEMGILSERKR